MSCSRFASQKPYFRTLKINSFKQQTRGPYTTLLQKMTGDLLAQLNRRLMGELMVYQSLTLLHTKPTKIHQKPFKIPLIIKFLLKSSITFHFLKLMMLCARPLIFIMTINSVVMVIKEQVKSLIITFYIIKFR